MEKATSARDALLKQINASVFVLFGYMKTVQIFNLIKIVSYVLIVTTFCHVFSPSNISCSIEL